MVPWQQGWRPDKGQAQPLPRQQWGVVPATPFPRAQADPRTAHAPLSPRASVLLALRLSPALSLLLCALRICRSRPGPCNALNPAHSSCPRLSSAHRAPASVTLSALSLLPLILVDLSERHPRGEVGESSHLSVHSTKDHDDWGRVTPQPGDQPGLRDGWQEPRPRAILLPPRFASAGSRSEE